MRQQSSQETAEARRFPTPIDEREPRNPTDQPNSKETGKFLSEFFGAGRT